MSNFVGYVFTLEKNPLDLRRQKRVICICLRLFYSGKHIEFTRTRIYVGADVFTEPTVNKT